MAQLVTVRLARHDSTPWGFRLQGGKDFGTPLLIQKVNGGSLAEQAGLAVGDGLIKVNGQDVFDLRHKDAQDAIVHGGNSLELQVQRGGGSTWKPLVTSIGSTPSPLPHVSGPPPCVTKTSLAANKYPGKTPLIGSGHNIAPKPFNGLPHSQLNGNANGSVKAIVNKQYNTPVGIYSEETIAETLSAQAEVLAGGVLGVNFKKNEKHYNAQNSEVLKMVQEADAEPRSPEPVQPSSVAYFATSSHAVGGRATSPRPLTPMAQQIAHNSPGSPYVVAKETNVAPTSTVDEPPNCSECGKIVVGVFVRIKDKNLHVECFKCATCGTSLKNVGYYNINNKLYCDIHAKMIARQNPPAPNLEPVTVSPGGRIPSNVVSNAINSAMSPKSNSVSSPFQTPSSNILSPKSFNGTSAPLTPPISSNFSPRPQTVIKESSHKIVWPPVETEEKFPTATPGYYPPSPAHPSPNVRSASPDSLNKLRPDEEAPSAFKPVRLSFEAQLRNHADLIENPPKIKFFNPTSTKSVKFSEEVNAVDRQNQNAFESHNGPPSEGYPLTRQLSVCSQEVLKTLVDSSITDSLVDPLDTGTFLEVINDGRSSPVPFSPASTSSAAVETDMLEGLVRKSCAERVPTPLPVLDSDNISEALEDSSNSVLELVNALEKQRSKTPLIDALTTASDRPYTPLLTSLVPIVPEPPVKETKRPRQPRRRVETEHAVEVYETKSVKELPKPKFEPGSMTRAMMIAPPIPYHELKPSLTDPVTLPKPVPLPPETKPYFPPSDFDEAENGEGSTRSDCRSPLMFALMTAPERCYSPLPSIVKPPSPPSQPLPSLDIDYIVQPPSFVDPKEDEPKSAFAGALKGKRLVPSVKSLSELRLENKSKEALMFPEQQLGGPQLPHLATELHKPATIPPYQQNIGETPYRPKSPRGIRAPEINPPPYQRSAAAQQNESPCYSSENVHINKVTRKPVSPSKISFLNESSIDNKRIPTLGYQPKSISNVPSIKDYDQLVSQLETHITKDAVQKHLNSMAHLSKSAPTANAKFVPGSLLY